MAEHMDSLVDTYSSLSLCHISDSPVDIAAGSLDKESLSSTCNKKSQS